MDISKNGITVDISRDRISLLLFSFITPIARNTMDFLASKASFRVRSMARNFAINYYL